MTTAITIRGSVRTLFSYSCPIVSIDPAAAAAAVRKSSSFQVFSTEEEEKKKMESILTSRKQKLPKYLIS